MRQPLGFLVVSSAAMNKISGKSKLSAHFKQEGYRDIFAIAYDCREESGGYQTEHTYETVVARKDDAYYKVVGHETAAPFRGRRFSIKSAQAITEEEFEAAIAEVRSKDEN
jgi:hypothetical protein